MARYKVNAIVMLALLIFTSLLANSAQKSRYFQITMQNITSATVELSYYNLNIENNLGGHSSGAISTPGNLLKRRRNVTQLIIDAAPLKYMYIYVGIFYLSVIIMIVVLDGAIPRLRGKIAVTTPVGSTDMLHSAYEEPRPLVHNIPPGYDTSLPSPPIPPLHNSGDKIGKLKEKD
ncbi:putative integral membrane protein [Acanthocheilonema viteae]